MAEGGRYGTSVVFLPAQADAQRLSAVAEVLLAVAGPIHWPTGSAETVHFTVRALEPFRADIPADDPLMRRGAAALERAASRSGPVRLRLRGMVLTSGGVMACAYPVDDGPQRFAASLADALGDDGWFERNFDRSIWYTTLLHFAGEVSDPGALVEWVRSRNQLDLGEVLFDQAHLLRWRFNGRQPVYTVVHAARLGTLGRAAAPARSVHE